MNEQKSRHGMSASGNAMLRGVALLGPHSQSLPIESEKQMFELIGYIAKPGRVGSFEAEVPVGSLAEKFETLFPHQVYRPIATGETPSGLKNKMGPQFRINFSNVTNCPKVLKENLRKGNNGCVARLNRSRFVIDLVRQYGFRFGDCQNLSAIREIAEKKGFKDDFDRGFNL